MYTHYVLICLILKLWIFSITRTCCFVTVQPVSDVTFTYTGTKHIFTKLLTSTIVLLANIFVYKKYGAIKKHVPQTCLINLRFLDLVYEQFKIFMFLWLIHFGSKIYFVREPFYISSKYTSYLYYFMHINFGL